VYAKESVVIGMAFKDAKEISLKRAALTTVHVGLQSFIGSFSYNSDSKEISVINTLSGITDSSGLRNEEQIQIHHGVFEDGDIVSAIDWSAATFKDESDEYCKTIKREILSLAISS
jgi:hypothetical protein